jgi:branched-chain amino acid aminotransferase
MEEIVYLNGSLIPRSQATVSVADYGFLYGYGLFETMRAYKGKIFLLDRHLKRLLDSAVLLNMNYGLSEEGLAKACNDTLQANHLADARLRLTISRGTAGPFPDITANTPPTVLVTATAYTPLASDLLKRGYTATVSSFRRNSGSLLSRLKTTSYLTSLLARMEAESLGVDEALLLNERSFIVEGSASNIFLVQESALSTPPVESGILPGITRGVVMELARDLGIGVEECEARLDELADFDEAFLTNSVMELVPLVQVKDKEGRVITIGSGRPGPVTKKLMAAYREMVARETGH